MIIVPFMFGCSRRFSPVPVFVRTVAEIALSALFRYFANM